MRARGGAGRAPGRERQGAFGPILPVVTYRTLDEVVGQDHLLKGDGPLARIANLAASRGDILMTTPPSL